MREVKFRGKRLDNGEWTYGNLLQGSKMREVAINDPLAQTAHDDTHQVDPETIGQFTGMLDRNLVEIYEDDIVKYKIPPIWTKGLVYYSDEWAIWHKGNNQNLSSYKKTTEVIGNKHDNPGLLP